jgi:hypothetical protein
MKSLARPSFFRMFDLMLATTNPGLKLMRWTHDGVELERERHSFTSARHGLIIEIVTLSRAGRRGWSLMVAKEYWWAGAGGKPFRNTRWARPLSGQRADLMAWLRAQEKLLERSSFLSHDARAAVGAQSIEGSEDDSVNRQED